MTIDIMALSLAEISRVHPAIADFIATAGAEAKPGLSLAGWLQGLEDEDLSPVGMDREQAVRHLRALVGEVSRIRAERQQAVRSLTIKGGRDKDGRPERLDLVLDAGDVVCIVGPTGSGKSRLLADIECLAQGDTPSGRRVLLNGAEPPPAIRFASNRKLIAQLSQNMNFVMDLSVGDFVAMHADCRMVGTPKGIVERVVACANDLAGESFSPRTSLTQLSGGQTRALMIADTALLSASPVVLIDEIENAGIDRKKALDLLIAEEKIILISTHDPILALLGQRRIVIRNGAVADVIETGAGEQANLAELERLDRALLAIRQRLREGERLDGPLPWPEKGGTSAWMR